MGLAAIGERIRVVNKENFIHFVSSTSQTIVLLPQVGSFLIEKIAPRRTSFSQRIA